MAMDTMADGCYSACIHWIDNRRCFDLYSNHSTQCTSANISLFKYFWIAWLMQKLNTRKYIMGNINGNAVLGTLSENYFKQKFIARNICNLRYVHNIYPTYEYSCTIICNKQGITGIFPPWGYKGMDTLYIVWSSLWLLFWPIRATVYLVSKVLVAIAWVC